jgi:hypothetical protein
VAWKPSKTYCNSKEMNFGGDDTLAWCSMLSQRCHKTANIPACLTRGVGGRKASGLLDNFPCCHAGRLFIFQKRIGKSREENYIKLHMVHIARPGY